jgi:tetratricopeptide (TPR) repeat protein/transcriptional regulator with XRE-family HTH domain
MASADGAGAPEPGLVFGKLETMEDLGYALRQLRRRCRASSGSKLTYRDLAERTGYSRGAIGNWLSGKSLPSADRLDDLAVQLGAARQEQRTLARARDEIEERRAAPATAPASEGPLAVPPRQLPRGNPKFAGRAGDLRTLTALLGQPDAVTAVVVVTGAAGIGKTAVALRWAHEHGDQFPGGQLWVDLQGFDPSGDPMPADVALRGFLGALGVAPSAIPADPQARSGLYRSLVAGRRMLVILDNARDASQVIPLLPGSPECAVLVTSRRQLAGLVTRYGAQSLDLGALAEAEARDLLRCYLGTGRLAAEPGAVAGILACCAGLPLAVSVVAARAGANPRLPLAALAAELREAATRLDALDAGDLGRLDQARASCAPALELYRRNHDREGEAATLHNLGYIEGRAGEHARAIHYYGMALALCRDLGNAYREAQTLDDLAQVHAACGQEAEARQAWQQALSLHQSQHRVADVTRIRQRLDTVRRSHV